MKVLIVAENFIMDGVKRVTSVLGNELAKENDVTYYSLADIESFYTLKAPLQIASHPIDSKGISFRGSQPLTRFKIQIDDLITTLKDGHFDAVIMTAGLLTSFIPVIKQQLPTVTAIAWMHNNVDTYLNNYYVHMQKEFKRGLRAANYVVVLTEYDLLGFLPFNPNTVKIYNPLTIVPTGEADLEKHNIAFTGRIDIQQKGIDFLVQVASLLPDDWHITIAGDGREKAVQEFHNFINQFHARHKIKYLGRLKDKELQKHYQNASLFMMTSRWEGLPLVIGEAMSFGLPIVTMYSTGADEYLANGQHGLLHPDHNPETFVQALKPLLKNLEQRQALAIKSLQRVKDFQISTILSEWMQILS
ncbi:glycosyltransferase [Pediococcus argentinicus]|uniref:glycosyltransferase n=1 Tax=Pediococcus argentinicus TaxID=480391 RepID=UPI00338E3B21